MSDRTPVRLGIAQPSCDEIASEILDDILREERIRKRYSTPKQGSFVDRSFYSEWIDGHMANNSSEVAHDTAKDEHIWRVRGRNC